MTAATVTQDHWHYMLHLARRIGRGRLDPEDLAQDVVERWLGAAQTVPPPVNPLAWMTVVLRRLAIDQLRRRRVRATTHDDVDALPAHEAEPPPWWLELDDATLATALGALPGAERATFQLFELDGKSYDQIARELQIAKATVGVRLLRARRRLRRLLGAPPAPRL